MLSPYCDVMLVLVSQAHRISPPAWLSFVLQKLGQLLGEGGEQNQGGEHNQGGHGWQEAAMQQAKGW